jgi:hypothetical protein
MAEHAGSQPGSGRAGGLDQLDEAMEDLAAATGAVLERYPRPGQAVRQVILCEHRDGGGSQLEEAILRPTAPSGSPATTKAAHVRFLWTWDHVL